MARVDGFCLIHQKIISREYDQRRGSPSKRGYDDTWQSFRKMRLAEDPLCADCFKVGLVTPSNEVHHIKTIKDFPELRLDRHNTECLCKACHSKKTFKRSFLTGYKSDTKVFIISGPPGSGKTSYAKEHMASSDLILDMDTIFQALTGLPYYEKPAAILPFVWSAYDAVIDRLQEPSEIYKAWVISGAPKADARAKLELRLNAQVIVLETHYNECMTRIMADDRRKDMAKHWESLVKKWWDDYQRRDGETIIKQ